MSKLTRDAHENDSDKHAGPEGNGATVVQSVRVQEPRSSDDVEGTESRHESFEARPCSVENLFRSQQERLARRSVERYARGFETCLAVTESGLNRSKTQSGSRGYIERISRASVRSALHRLPSRAAWFASPKELTSNHADRA